MDLTPSYKRLASLAEQHKKDVENLKSLGRSIRKFSPEGHPYLLPYAKEQKLREMERELENAREAMWAKWRNFDVEKYDFLNYVDKGKSLPPDRIANYPDYPNQHSSRRENRMPVILGGAELEARLREGRRMLTDEAKRSFGKGKFDAQILWSDDRHWGLQYDPKTQGVSVFKPKGKASPLSGLLPMPPSEGPPLPRALGIKWPNNSLVWMRIGDLGDYEQYDSPYSAGRRVGSFQKTIIPMAETSFRWRKMGVEISPQFKGQNYISLYWGDKDAQPDRELTDSEKGEFIKGVQDQIVEYRPKIR